MDPATLAPVPAQQRKITGRTKLALWLMIGPTALLVVSFIGYAIINWIFMSAPAAADSTALFTAESPAKVILNILFFLTGAISVVTGLPGLIIGIVLLATPKK